PPPGEDTRGRHTIRGLEPTSRMTSSRRRRLRCAAADTNYDRDQPTLVEVRRAPRRHGHRSSTTQASAPYPLRWAVLVLAAAGVGVHLLVRPRVRPAGAAELGVHALVGIGTLGGAGELQDGGALVGELAAAVEEAGDVGEGGGGHHSATKRAS